jgi:hypothetical protein
MESFFEIEHASSAVAVGPVEIIAHIALQRLFEAGEVPTRALVSTPLSLLRVKTTVWNESRELSILPLYWSRHCFEQNCLSANR